MTELSMNDETAVGIEFKSTKQVTHNGQAARTVSGSRYYDTNADDLWDALTSPERIPRWFLPISGELRAGGQFQLEGHAGGKVTRCEPPAAFDATWQYGDNISWITIRIKPENNGVRLTLDHIMLKDEEGEAHWKLYGPGATGVGWELSFLALNYHLANNGAAIDATENEAWLGSDAGKAFISKSAKGWGDAHVASGESEDTARDMAALTARFYTGE